MRNTRSWLKTLGVTAVTGCAITACGDSDPGKITSMPSASSAAGPEDANTAAENSKVPVPDAGAGDAEEPVSDALFNHPHVPGFEFQLPAQVWAELQENAQDEQYVEAQLTFEGTPYGSVGLRFKGSYGSLYSCFDEQGEMICPRLGMKVKFDKYVNDQRFYGLKRLNFHAYRHDDSRMRERLTYDLYRAVGVVAPRASWAVVRVNGESLGLFGMVEQIDGRLTANRWPNAPDGNLYKEVWPTETQRGAALDALDTNEEVGDVSAFTAFAEALVAADPADARATLGSYMDLDYLARYMAVDDATANYDGVTYFWTDGTASVNHNFYIYENTATEFTLIPWDVESTFWINPDHAAPHWTELPDDCTETYSYWEGLASAPGCNTLFRALATDLSGWRTASRELLDGPFALETMLTNIARYEAFIADEAHADPTPSMYTSFDSAVAVLRDSIPDLRARLETLIDP